MSSYQYRNSHCGDKTVVRSSYLCNGISYTGKTASLYWIGAQLSMHLSCRSMPDRQHSLTPFFTHSDHIFICLPSPLMRWIANSKDFIQDVALCTCHNTVNFIAVLYAIWCHNELCYSCHELAGTWAPSQYKDRLSQVWGFPSYRQSVRHLYIETPHRQLTVLPVRVRICPDARAEDTIVWLSPEIIVMPWVCSQFKVSVAVASV